MARTAVTARASATKKAVKAAKAKVATSTKRPAVKKVPVPAKANPKATAKPIPAATKKVKVDKKAPVALAPAKKPAKAAKAIERMPEPPAPKVQVAPPAPASVALEQVIRSRSAAFVEPDSIEAVIKLEQSDDISERKLWSDIRDRAAYVMVSGALPTHLRPGTVRLLRQMTEISKAPTAIDGSAGAVRLKDSFIQSFRLHEHPLVLQARRYVGEGYHLSVSRGPTERRPFGRVWLYRPVDEARAYKATIHSSGAVQAGWV